MAEWHHLSPLSLLNSSLQSSIAAHCIPVLNDESLGSVLHRGSVLRFLLPPDGVIGSILDRTTRSL